MARTKPFYGITGDIKLKGLSQTLSVLSREIEAIKDRTLKGLIKAQARIHESMDSVAPKIPVDTGNLRRSYFCVTSKGGVIAGRQPRFDDKRDDAQRLVTTHDMILAEQGNAAIEDGKKGPAIRFGFTAYYAPAVHEMYGAHFKRAGAGAGFFEEAVHRNRKYVLKVIAQEAKIKK